MTGSRYRTAGPERRLCVWLGDLCRGDPQRERCADSGHPHGGASSSTRGEIARKTSL